MRARIFDLSRSGERSYFQRFLCWLNVVSTDRITGPDFYIIHRVGLVMRLWALALCVLAFTMAHLHHFYGVMPELSLLYDKPTFLGTFIGLINAAGRVMVVILVYYFAVFFRSISFFEYNPLRHHAAKTSKHGGLKALAQYTMSPLIILLVLTHFGSGFGYFTTLEHTQWIYNSAPFVLILSVVSVFGLSIVAQALFFVTIVSTYVVFERM